MAKQVGKLAVRSERTGASFDYDRIGMVSGVTIGGAPVYVEIRDDDRIGSLVTVTRSGHAAAVNTAPQTDRSHSFGPLRIVVDGEPVSMTFGAAALACERNRCERWTAIVPLNAVVMPDGSVIDGGGAVLAVVVKNRDQSSNATGQRAGSIIGKRIFRDAATAAAWRHMVAGR